jgi:UDP-N-acetylmuramate dehydrogenase
MIQENIPLKEYTTFKIGGPARYFLTVSNIAEAIDFAREKKLPYFVLGGGSNLLVGDEGFNGVVIKLENKKIELKKDLVIADAGAKLSSLVDFTVENNLTGLEWAAGIPGTVGGAVRGNAGAFGHSISENIKEVKTLHQEKDYQFGYRDSIFKHNNDVILSAVFKFNKGADQELIDEYLKTRKEKHPVEPSAGCIFQNPKPLSAGKLIEDCGLKGKRIGDAMISPKQANFIVNLGSARAEDVKKLISLVKKEVKKKFQVELKEEVQYL